MLTCYGICNIQVSSLETSYPRVGFNNYCQKIENIINVERHLRTTETPVAFWSKEKKKIKIFVFDVSSI